MARRVRIGGAPSRRSNARMKFRTWKNDNWGHLHNSDVRHRHASGAPRGEVGRGGGMPHPRAGHPPGRVAPPCHRASRTCDETGSQTKTERRTKSNGREQESTIPRQHQHTHKQTREVRTRARKLLGVRERTASAARRARGSSDPLPQLREAERRAPPRLRGGAVREGERRDPRLERNSAPARASASRAPP